MNHKPEMIYALTEFSALVGFRVPRKARGLLVGLEGELAGACVTASSSRPCAAACVPGDLAFRRGFPSDP